MKRMKYYTCETLYFPMIKNSWGWIANDESEFIKLKSSIDLSIGLTFEEIIEFFKSY